MSDFKIAIVGAGPAGCMLAHLLHLSGIPVTIFEAEQSVDFGSQGGTLDLHTETGLKAIKKGNLYSEFLKYARFDGEALTIADKHFVKYLKVNGSAGKSTTGRPEIDRPRLREILIESLPKECIVWDKRVTSVGPDLTLNFEDGSEKGFDLIVGADGAFSKVRPTLSSANVMYSGIGGHEGTIPDAESRHPDLYKIVNRGSIFCLSDHKFIVAQQYGDGSVHTVIWRAFDEKPFQKLSSEKAVALKKSGKEEFHDWDPRLLEFLGQSEDDSFLFRPLYMLPIGHSWEHKPGVTLNGDAAHLMTPFSGEGVNLAFADCMALAEAITKARNACKASSDDKHEKLNKNAVLSQEVRTFEAGMFKQAAYEQQRTYDNLKIVFFKEGPPWLIVRACFVSLRKRYRQCFTRLYLYFVTFTFTSAELSVRMKTVR